LALNITKVRKFALTLFSGLILIQIIGVSSVLMYQYRQTQNLMQSRVDDLIHGIADETEENARSFLVPAESSIGLIADLLESQVFDPEQWRPVEHHFLAHLIRYEHIDGLYLGELDGEFLYVRRNSDSEIERTGAAFTTKRIHGQDGRRRADFIYRAADRRHVGQELDREDSYDPRDRPWFKKAMQVNGRIWTDPYIFYTSRQPGVSVAVPWFDAEGEVLGVVGADIELEQLSTFLADQPIGKNGLAVLLDERGRIIADSQNRLLDAWAGTDKLGLPTVDEYGDDRLSASMPTLDALTRTAGQFEKNNPRFVVNGGYYFSILKQFFSDIEQKWFINIVASEDDFLGTLKSNQSRTLLLTLFLGALITIASIWTAFRLAVPISRLETAAVTDHLTGLLNRRGMVESLPTSNADNGSEGAPTHLLLVDIDHFKQVNDRLGFSGGDQILKSVAQRIRRFHRRTEMIARLGGDEFAIIYKAPSEQARDIAENICDSIKRTPIKYEGEQITVTASAGLAPGIATITDFERGMKLAGEALRRAKHSGRGCIEMVETKIEEEWNAVARAS
jgi:diguanylate cyclase (GGDEF)-like protein